MFWVAFHKLPTISWVNLGPFLLTELVYYLTMLVIYEHLNILAMFFYNIHPAQPEADWPALIAWFLSRFLPRVWPF